MPKILFFFFILLGSINGLASPAPFSIAINKSTINKVKETYKLTFLRKNAFGDDVYSIATENIKFDGLSSLLLVAQKDIVIGIYATINKNRFDDILKNLNNKYQLKEQHTPFVGNKDALFIKDDVTIFIDAPHSSFSMTLGYINASLYEKTIKAIEESEAKQEKKEAELL